MTAALRCAFLALVLLAAGCQQPAARVETLPPSGDWDALVDAYIEATFQAMPPLGVRAGRHEFDGRMPPLTRESFEESARRLKQFRDRARAFDPAALDRHRRFEREYLLAEITSELFWLEVDERQY